MSERVIFNADDFGMSLGVNAAIEKAYREGVLNSASLMINQKYASEAIEASKNMPDLEIGLHVNLTNEFPAADPADLPLLTGKDGRFKNGFVKLLLLSFLRPEEFKKEVRTEIEAQILKAQKMGVELKHLDSHRHVHMIPSVFDVLREMAEKYGIGRLRTMNECALLTLQTNKEKSFLFDGGIIKYFLLRFLSVINAYQTDTYFYTILYTCKLSASHFKKVFVPQGYRRVEIMIHPSCTEIDRAHKEDIFDENVLSPWREAELQTLLNKDVVQAFEFEHQYPFVIKTYRRLENLWFKLGQKLRFVLVGGFNTVLAYAFYAFLLKVLELPYLWALIVQYFVTVNISIWTMRYFVFRSVGAFVEELYKAWSVYIGMFFFNSLILSLLIKICHIDPLWAQGIYLIVSTILTYLLHKYFSFHKKIKEK